MSSPSTQLDCSTSKQAGGKTKDESNDPIDAPSRILLIDHFERVSIYDTELPQGFSNLQFLLFRSYWVGFFTLLSGQAKSQALGFVVRKCTPKIFEISHLNSLPLAFDVIPIEFRSSINYRF